MTALDLEPDHRNTAVLRVPSHEFFSNPEAMLARLAQGEQLEVTRHGDVVALVSPPPSVQSRYDELVSRGVIQPAARDLTAGDWDDFTHIEIPDDVDPVAMLLEMREDDR